MSGSVSARIIRTHLVEGDLVPGSEVALRYAFTPRETALLLAGGLLCQVRDRRASVH